MPVTTMRGTPIGQPPAAAVPVTQPATTVAPMLQTVQPPRVLGVPNPNPPSGNSTVLTTPTADFMAQQQRVPTPSVADQPEQIITPGTVA
eukprot:scaffold8882_cov51-Attheya_sp.AAC.2